MQSKLDLVEDWEERFQRCGFKAYAVAHDCGVTLRFLEKYFQTRFASKPHVWSVKLRMQRAERLLVRGTSVKAVAYELGYRTAGNFSRDFKRFHGTTPRRYFFHIAKLRP